jgi:hypothetical protein
MAGGQPFQPFTGLEGMPFGDSPLALLAQPFLRQTFGQNNMAMLGLNDQNMLDTMRRARMTQMQQAMIQQGAELEQENYMRFFRGMAHMTGTPWGAEQRRSARALSETMAGVPTTVIARMAPQVLDVMGGARGSPTVMAQQMFLGSRQRIDPLTGQVGMTRDSMTAMTDIFTQAYEEGRVQDLHGLRAGELGQLYRGLSRRGMLPGPPGVQDLTDETRADLREAMDRAGIDRALPDHGRLRFTTEELDRLGETNMGEDAIRRVRQLNVREIRQTLEGYTEAISAVQDIFGGRGQPNAPMPQLLNALDAMTQGTMHQMQPGQIGQMVRTTQQMTGPTGLTGIPFERAMAMQRNAANIGNQLGLHPLAAQQANQRAMAFHLAFRNTGMGEAPLFGSHDAEQAAQVQQRLVQGAAGSDFVNRMAAASRLMEAGALPEDSAARRFVEAAREGRNTFQADGEAVRLGDVDQGRFRQMMERAGIDRRTVESMLADRQLNQREVVRHGLQLSAMDEQAEDLADRATTMVRGFMRNTEGITGEQAARLAPRYVELLRNMNPRELANAAEDEEDNRRNQVARLIADETGMDVSEARQLVPSFRSQLNRRLRASELPFENFNQLYQQINPELLRETQLNRLRAQARGQMASAVSAFGRGGVLRRAFQAVQEAGPDDDLTDILQKSLGGVEMDAGLREDIREGMSGVREKMEQAEEIRVQARNADTPEERRRLLTEHRRLARQANQQATDLRSLLADTPGLDLEISEEEQRKATRERLRETTQEVLQDTDLKWLEDADNRIRAVLDASDKQRKELIQAVDKDERQSLRSDISYLQQLRSEDKKGDEEDQEPRQLSLRVETDKIVLNTDEEGGSIEIEGMAHNDAEVEA